MTTYSNIHNRFGPPWDNNLNRRAHGFVDFYRAFVAQMFGFDDGYPKTASLRASRSHEGATRIIPLSYLAGVILPGDYPLLSGDPTVPGEDDLQAHYETHLPLKDLVVSLPNGAPPVLDTRVSTISVPGFTKGGVGRHDLCRLAAARAIGFDEIAVRILWGAP